MKYHAMFQPCPKCGNVMNARSKTCGLCAGKGRKGELHLTVCRCESCGDQFSLPQWRVNQGRGRFCSKPCRDKWHTTLVGELSSKYRGAQGRYRGYNWASAKRAALEAYNYRCAACGTDLKTLGPRLYVVHHTIPYRLFTNDDQANALDNLRPMCKSCHAKEEGLGKTARKVVMSK